MTEMVTKNDHQFQLFASETTRCTLVAYHAPLPVMVEMHHSKPEYLQKRLWGEVRYPADTLYCSNCHDAVHAWLYYLMGERRAPNNVGRNAKAAAEAIHAWYVAEQAHTGDNPVRTANP